MVVPPAVVVALRLLGLTMPQPLGIAPWLEVAWPGLRPRRVGQPPPPLRVLIPTHAALKRASLGAPPLLLATAWPALLDEARQDGDDVGRARPHAVRGA